MSAQDVQLAGEIGGREQVASLGVARHETQSLPLPAAADHDRRVRLGERLRGVQRAIELIVRATERSLVAAPHLQADLQGLLKPLEPLSNRRERDAEPLGLLLVPGRADAKPGAAAREHVERADNLRQNARIAVDRTCHEREQIRPGGVRCQVSEGGIRLKHLVVGRPDAPDLEEAGHGGEVGAEPPRTSRPGVVGNLQSYLHELTLLLSSGVVFRPAPSKEGGRPPMSLCRQFHHRPAGGVQAVRQIGSVKGAFNGRAAAHHPVRT